MCIVHSIMCNIIQWHGRHVQLQCTLHCWMCNSVHTVCQQISQSKSEPFMAPEVWEKSSVQPNVFFFHKDCLTKGCLYDKLSWANSCCIFWPPGCFLCWSDQFMGFHLLFLELPLTNRAICIKYIKKSHHTLLLGNLY